jgi:hypothetical protein
MLISDYISPQMVYVTRNPRDTCISYMSHWKLMYGYKGSTEAIVDVFLNDETGVYTPYFQQVLGYWNRRDLPNIQFITYEEMKRDLPNIIRK